MDPQHVNQRREEDEPEMIAGIIEPTGQGRRAFRPDSEAPPVDREALAMLWAKEVDAPDIRRLLITNVLRYRVWFEAMHDVVMNDIANTRGSGVGSSGELPQGGA